MKVFIKCIAVFFILITLFVNSSCTLNSVKFKVKNSKLKNDIYYISVDNDVSMIDFEQYIECNKRWFISKDKNTNNYDLNKKMVLKNEDNYFYIFVEKDEDKFITYEIIVRRLPLWTVRFISNVDNYIEYLSIQEGDKCIKPNDPVKVGYTFIGWYVVEYENENEYEYDFTQPVMGSIVLRARYEIISYPINYHTDGALVNKNPTSYTIHDNIELLPVYKEGYTFEGWYTDPNFTNKITTISYSYGEINLYANYGMYATFVLNSGNLFYSNKEEMVDNFLNDLTIFMEDVRNDDTYGYSGGKKAVTLDDLYPFGQIGWELISTSYKTDCFFNDLSMRVKWSWIINYITKVRAESDLSTHIFEYFDEGYSPSPSSFTSEIACFLSNTHKTNWPQSANYLNDDNANNFWDYVNKYDRILIVDELIPIVPIRKGYRFDGWYDNPECLGDKITSVTSQCTLYAAWVEENTSSQVYNIWYELNGGVISSDAPKTFELGETVQLVNPTSSIYGCKFLGWSTDPYGENIITEISSSYRSDVTLFAIWIISN